jgi:very-short-patch-repair endonuclease
MSITEIGRRRLKQIFQYLEAFNQQRNPVIRQVEEQEWALRLNHLPVHPTITRTREAGDSFVIKVGRANLTTAPPPPFLIRDWVRPGWDDPFKEEKIVEYKSENDRKNAELKIRFEDSPSRINAYQEWVTERQAWAAEERPAREAYQVFERVYALYNRIEREAGRLELVLGDGILNWRLPQLEINHPILLQRIQLSFDPKAPEFIFQLTEQPIEFYTALLRENPVVEPKLIAQVCEECEKADFDLLDASTTSEFLRGLVTRLASAGHFIPQGGMRGVSDVPRIALDPVILARQRTLGYARSIESILEEIPRLEVEEIPSSLLNITGVWSPENTLVENGELKLDGGGNEDEEILFNKPANPEQLLIAKRLERFGSVLVQGPPGTGKTHTIANLIGHLLAEGKSVLVTSHTTKALRVLREKVDPRIQSLCVSVLDNDSDSQAQMSAAIGEIAERLNDDLVELERKSGELRGTRDEVITGLKNLRRRLYEARASEYTNLDVEGKPYQPSQAARLVREGRGVNDWIPGLVVTGNSLPLDEREISELYQTNRIIPPEDEKYLASTLPDPELLIPPHEFDLVISDLDSLGSEAENDRKELWKNVPSLTSEDLSVLLARLKEAVEPINQGVNDPFKIALINDGRRGDGYRAPWDDLIGRIVEVVKAAGESLSLILAQGPQPAAEIQLDQQAVVLEEIIEHLEAGGNLGKLNLMLRSEWKAVIDQSRVDGKRPSKPAHFKALLAAVRLESLRASLVSRWDRQLGPLGVPSAKNFGSRPEEACSQFVDQINYLLGWQSEVWESAERALADAGFKMKSFLLEVPLNLQPNGDLFRLADAVGNYLPPIFDARIAKLRRDELQRRLKDYRTQIKELPVSGHSLELIGELRRAVETVDLSAYTQAFTRIVDLHSRRQTYLRRQVLLERLDRSAPGWATAIRLRNAAHSGETTPGDPTKAWLWRQFNDRLNKIGEESITAIQSEIERSVDYLHRVTTELIEASSWAHQIRRTELPQKQSLNGWVQTMRKIGRGTGKRVPQLLTQARSLMDECRSAVPVWIMPLARVVENFKPQHGLFDVVIIDEASQCDIMGLIALYLGKKVIVVGDHEQVSPDAVGNTAESAQNLINIYLREIPNAELYDGKLSIYDLAAQSFGGTVCLREHFRCVPEIIGFSNELSYEGKIKPLRDSTHNPLSPAVIAHHVNNGHSNSKVNEAEAETIASLIVSAIEQPEYKDQTFGVISLVGEDQAAAIERILRSKLSPAEFAGRKITCGNAAQFQGDERQVMFLSVIDGGGQGQLRIRQEDLFKKRFNVAASRAQNQLWVVHSLVPTVDLQSNDLRRKLIEYAQYAKRQTATIDGQSMRAESELERLVMRELSAAGYQVTPRWKVGIYRIDMVVSGGGRRVAIECDGDRHYPMEQIPEDMERQAVLERLGWKFLRIRGSQFFRDPDRIMKDVIANIDSYGVTSQAAAEGQFQDGNELTSRVIRLAEQKRAEWFPGDIDPPAALPEEPETIDGTGTPWEISIETLETLEKPFPFRDSAIIGTNGTRNKE